MKFPVRLFWVVFCAFLLNSPLFSQGPMPQQGRPQPGPRAGQSGPNAPGDRFSEGEKDIRREMYARARREFESDPNSSRAQYMIGEIFLRTNKLDSAQVAFRRGLTIDPEDGMCIVGLGQTMLERSPLDAEKLFAQAAGLRKYRKDAQIPVRIARAYLSVRTPDFGKVQTWLDKAFAINLSEPQIYLVQGDMNMMKDKVGDAVNSFKNALMYDPNNLEARYKLGAIYQRARQYPEAMENITKALAIDSLHIPSYRVAGELNYRRGQYGPAAESYRRMMRLGEGNIDDQSRFAASLFFDKKYDEALPELDNVLRRNPNHPAALRLSAYAFQYKGQYDQGVSSMEKFFKVVKPEDIQDMDYLYYARLLMGVHKDSLAYLNFMKGIYMADSEDKKSNLYSELLDSINSRKQYELEDIYFQRYDTIGRKLKASDYLQWGKACLYAGFDRVNKNTPQDTLVGVRFMQKADSLFVLVSSLAPPEIYVGLYYQAKSKDILDRILNTFEAKPLYDLLLENPKIGNREKMDAYLYMGYFYATKEDYNQVLVYYTKYLELDPSNKLIKERIDLLNKTLSQKK